MLVRVVSRHHVPGPRGISPGHFLPQQGIVSMFFSGAGRQPISASPVLFLANVVWKYGSRGCNTVGCANTNDRRPTNTRSCFSAPEAVLNEVEQRFDCVQAQTHMYPSLVGGFHPHPEPNSSLPSPEVAYTPTIASVPLETASLAQLQQQTAVTTRMDNFLAHMHAVCHIPIQLGNYLSSVQLGNMKYCSFAILEYPTCEL